MAQAALTTSRTGPAQQIGVRVTGAMGDEIARRVIERRQTTAQVVRELIALGLATEGAAEAS